MKWILFIFRQIWKGYFALIFISTFLILYPVIFITLKNKNWYHIAFKLKRWVALTSVFLSGIVLKVKRDCILDKNKAYVICCNHTSFLDVVLAYCLFDNYFVFMAKKELQKVPLFGEFIRTMDISVDRQSRLGSYKAFKQAELQLEENKCIILFPEGTIPLNSPEMIRFKNGAFKLAIEKQVPIVPVTFLSNYKIFPSGNNFYKFGGPGIASVVIHNIVETNKFNDDNVSFLRDKVRSIIEKPLL